MKKSLFFAAIAICAIFVSCKTDKSSLETPKEKHSYAVGMDLGRIIKLQIDPELLDYSVVIQAIKDQLDTTRPVLMNDSAFAAAMQDLMVEIRNAPLRAQNKFLEKNKGEPGVVATASGLQYMVLAEGGGAAAKDGDTVVVHYTGTLLDGKKFDSSLDRNQPLSIVLAEGQVIMGWVEMLRLMKKGEKVRAWIPSSLGYGEAGNPVIPGNSLLIFDMELLDIKTAQ
uniref:Peptidyl-prolyl cis-trans isomerase n=1 Tax=uncultured bacterium contig00016 TaxID=1181507 RepID=A0A806KLX0_9BACT|nr:FKBP-type peptidyl-prolyl cis-trans isomerase FkpA precursor [uncultured bacterium contig00016]